MMFFDEPTKLDICCADEAASPDLIVTKNETCTVRDVKGLPHPCMGAMLVSRFLLPVIAIFCITELDAKSVRHVLRPKRTQRHISSLPIFTIEFGRISPMKHQSARSRNRRMQTPRQADYAYHYHPNRVYSDLNDIYVEKPRRARAHLLSREDDDTLSYVPRFSMRLPKRSQRSAHLRGVRGLDGERALPIARTSKPKGFPVFSSLSFRRLRSDTLSRLHAGDVYPARRNPKKLEKLPFINTSIKRTELEPLPMPRPAPTNLNRNVIPDTLFEPSASGINAGVEGFGFSQEFINIDAEPKITINGKDGAITTALLTEGTGNGLMQANTTANSINNRAIKHSPLLRTEATPASNPDETTEEKALTQLESPNEIREVYGLPNQVIVKKPTEMKPRKNKHRSDRRKLGTTVNRTVFQDVEFVTEVKQLPNKEAPDGVSSSPKRRKSKSLLERETIHINRRF